MDEKTKKKLHKLFIEALRERKEELEEEKNKNNSKISFEAYKRLFPKSYERLLRLRVLKEKARKKLEELSIKKLNENCKEHPEPLLWYLYQAEQITDLTKEDIKKINEYVRQRKKDDPHCDMWEIEED